eukprot:124764-Lingulodinium_polyedra.AAC.1
MGSKARRWSSRQATREPGGGRAATGPPPGQAARAANGGEGSHQTSRPSKRREAQGQQAAINR